MQVSFVMSIMTREHGMGQGKEIGPLERFIISIKYGRKHFAKFAQFAYYNFLDKVRSIGLRVLSAKCTHASRPLVQVASFEKISFDFCFSQANMT